MPIIIRITCGSIDGVSWIQIARGSYLLPLLEPGNPRREGTGAALASRLGWIFRPFSARVKAAEANANPHVSA